MFGKNLICHEKPFPLTKTIFYFKKKKPAAIGPGQKRKKKSDMAVYHGDHALMRIPSGTSENRPYFRRRVQSVFPFCCAITVLRHHRWEDRLGGPRKRPSPGERPRPGRVSGSLPSAPPVPRSGFRIPMLSTKKKKACGDRADLKK